MTEQSHNTGHSLNSQGSQAASHLNGGGSQFAGNALPVNLFDSVSVAISLGHAVKLADGRVAQCGRARKARAQVTEPRGEPVTPRASGLFQGLTEDAGSNPATSIFAMKHDKEQIIENVKQDLTEKLGEEVSA